MKIFNIKNKIIFICTLLLFPSIGLSDEEFEKWQNKQNNTFKKYQDDLDKEFSSFLKKKWEEFNTKHGFKIYQEDKPKQLPTIKPIQSAIPDFPENKLTLPNTIKKENQSNNITSNKGNYQFLYFGSKLQVQLDKNLQQFVFPFTTNQDSISQYWEQLSQINIKKLVLDLKNIKKNLELNDWGYGNLVQHFTQSVFKNSESTQKVFIWFVMIKSGYDVSLGFSHNAYFILTASETVLYNTSFIVKKENPYYVIDFQNKIPKVKKIHTYKGKYPKKLKKINLLIETSPSIDSKKTQIKNIKFKFRSQDFALRLNLNESLKDFLNEYPQTTFPVYFSSPLSSSVHNDLVKFVQKNVKNLSEIEAVNFVLRFVQKGFKYKTDQEQFGVENYFFPDETLFYNYSDCEDRVALFNSLIRNALGLKVISLHYPNHVASAVQINSKASGDKIKFLGKNYFVTDPTYIGADIGMTMPNLKNITPKIITLY